MKPRIGALLASLAVLAAQDAAASTNLVMVAEVRYPMVDGGTRVAVSGGYAYGVSGSLDIFDVSNPGAPRLVTRFAPGGGQDVAAAGRFVFVATGDGRLRVVDATNPVSPSLVAQVVVPGITRIAVSGDYHLFVGTGGSAPSLKVFDVSNPAAPTQVGSVALPAGPAAIALAGATAYVADLGGGLRVVDISIPAAPRELSSLAIGTAYGVAVSGTSAYVTTHGYQCDPDYCGGTPGTFHVVDVSNPSCPRVVSSTARVNASEDVVVWGRDAYVVEEYTDYASGEYVGVLDVASDPPIEVAWTESGWGANGKSIAVSGGYLYMPLSQGLRIYRAYGADAPPPACTP